MEKIKSMILNHHISRNLYKPWMWPWVLLSSITRPVHPGVFMLNFITQRIFRISADQKFMVHYSSYVNGNVFIGKNVWISFASSGGCYVQGDNGIYIGNDTIFAPGVKIISANHDLNDKTKWVVTNPIKIGKKCWIGANAVILAEVELGDNVVVGAGSVVTKSFPDNVIIAGVPAKIIKENKNDSSQK